MMGERESLFCKCDLPRGTASLPLPNSRSCHPSRSSRPDAGAGAALTAWAVAPPAAAGVAALLAAADLAAVM